MRSAIKGLLETILLLAPRRTPASASLVLAYHNVVERADAGCGDVSLHLELDDFIAQLRAAAGEADVVDLPTLVESVGQRGRRIAITFDDAYRGAMTHGITACAGQGITPTVFVAPGLYGVLPFWDRAAALNRWSSQDRNEFLTVHQGKSRSADLYDAPWLPLSYRIIDEHSLRELAQSRAIHIGNHTFSHVNLGAVTTREADDEIARGAQHVESFGKAATRLLAFPYGIAPIGEASTKPLRCCDVAFLVDGGWHASEELPLNRILPRLNVPAGISLKRFKAQLRGWP